MERLNATGKVFLTHTTLMGRDTIRASFAGQYTQSEHVEQLQGLQEVELKQNP